MKSFILVVMASAFTLTAHAGVSDIGSPLKGDTTPQKVEETLGCDTPTDVSYPSKDCVQMRADAVVRAQVIKEKGALISSTGAVFTRDTSKPRFGEAYRDPSGLIWSNLSMSAQFSGAMRLQYEAAVRLCTWAGGRLPTKSEFEKLYSYLGAKYEEPYTVVNYKLQDGKTAIIPGLMLELTWTSTKKGNFFTGGNGLYWTTDQSGFDRADGKRNTSYGWAGPYGDFAGIRCVSGN